MGGLTGAILGEIDFAFIRPEGKMIRRVAEVGQVTVTGKNPVMILQCETLGLILPVLLQLPAEPGKVEKAEY